MSVFLFALGAALRLGLWTFPRSIWCDEAASVDCSSATFWETLKFYAGDAHPPLYFVTLHASMKAFGFHEWTFRLPSVLAGLLALWAIYLFTKELFGRNTGLLALYLSAISPFALHMSGEIRNHGFAMAFTALASYFLLKCVREPENKRWGWAYAAAAWAAVGTTHFAWLWALGLIAAHAWAAATKKVPVRTLGCQLAFLFAAAPFAALFMIHAGREAAASFPGHRDLLNIVWYFFHGLAIPVSFMSKSEILFFLGDSPLFLFFVSVFFLVLAAVASSVLRAAAQKNRTPLFLIGLLALPMLVVDLYDTERFYARYFAFLYFILPALTAHGLLSLRTRFLKGLGIGLVSVACAFSSAFVLAYPGDAHEQSHFSSFVRFLSAQSRAGDAVFCDRSLTDFHVKIENALIPAKLLDETEFKPEMLGDFERIWLTETLLREPGAAEALRERGFFPEGPRLFFEHSIILSLFSRNGDRNAARPPIVPMPVEWRHGMEWFAPIGQEMLRVKNRTDWDAP